MTDKVPQNLLEMASLFTDGYRQEFIKNGYGFSQRDCQLLIALTFWIEDAEGRPLSDSTKSQVMLWRRSSQGTLPIAGLFDSIVHSSDPEEREWVRLVLDNQWFWKKFAQDQYDSLEGALYMKSSQELVSTEHWRRLVNHLTPTQDPAEKAASEAECPGFHPPMVAETMYIVEHKEPGYSMDNEPCMDGPLEVQPSTVATHNSFMLDDNAKIKLEGESDHGDEDWTSWVIVDNDST